MSVHPIVLATIRKHLADAELAVARLTSQAATIPATRRANDGMLHLTKRIKEAQAIFDAWASVEREVES